MYELEHHIIRITSILESSAQKQNKGNVANRFRMFHIVLPCGFPRQLLFQLILINWHELKRNFHCNFHDTPKSCQECQTKAKITSKDVLPHDTRASAQVAMTWKEAAANFSATGFHSFRMNLTERATQWQPTDTRGLVTYPLAIKRGKGQYPVYRGCSY